MEELELNEGQEQKSEDKKKNPLGLIVFVLILLALVIFLGFKIGSNLSKTPINRYGVLLNDYYLAHAKNDTNRIQELSLKTIKDETAGLDLKAGKYFLFLYEISETNVKSQDLKELLFGLEVIKEQARTSFLNKALVISTNGELLLKEIKVLYKTKNL